MGPFYKNITGSELEKHNIQARKVYSLISYIKTSDLQIE